MLLSLLDIQLSCLEAAPERLSMSDSLDNMGQHGRQCHCLSCRIITDLTYKFVQTFNSS